MRPNKFSDLTLPAPKIEFESCILLKTRSDSELSKKKWRNNSSERIFSKHFGPIHLVGLRVLKHFSQKKKVFSPRFISLSLHFPFRILSSFSSCLFFSLSSSLSSSSCLFSCLASSPFQSSLCSSLFFHLVSSSRLSALLSSFIFSLLSSSLFSSLFLSFIFPISPLSSSRVFLSCVVFSCLLLSCLSFSVFFLCLLSLVSLSV